MAQLRNSFFLGTDSVKCFAVSHAIFIHQTVLISFCPFLFSLLSLCFPQPLPKKEKRSVSFVSISSVCVMYNFRMEVPYEQEWFLHEMMTPGNLEIPIEKVNWNNGNNKSGHLFL